MPIYKMPEDAQEELITTSHGVMTRSQLDAFNKREKEEKAARDKERAQRIADMVNRKPLPFCPFSDNRRECKGDACALYVDGCTLAKIGNRTPAKDTKGLQCPLGRYKTACREDCALYKNGCTITAMKESEE